MTVQILLSHNDIEINRPDQLGFTPLMRAAQDGHHAAIAELLTHPAIAINLRNISGMSALILAVERGHTEVVQQLLSVAGVNFQQRDNAGRSPLTLAQRRQHPRIAALLERYAADAAPARQYLSAHGDSPSPSGQERRVRRRVIVTVRPHANHNFRLSLLSSGHIYCLRPTLG